MAAARYSSDVLQMFNGSIKEEENANLPRPLPPDLVGVYYGFTLARNNFQERPRVWKKDVPEDNEYNNDLLVYARETNAWFINLLEKEIKALQSVN